MTSVRWQLFGQPHLSVVGVDTHSEFAQVLACVSSGCDDPDLAWRLEQCQPGAESGPNVATPHDGHVGGETELQWAHRASERVLSKWYCAIVGRTSHQVAQAIHNEG